LQNTKLSLPLVDSAVIDQWVDDSQTEHRILSKVEFALPPEWKVRKQALFEMPSGFIQLDDCSPSPTEEAEISPLTQIDV